MGRRQSQMFHIPQRRSARSSGSGLGFVGAVFAAFLLLLGIGFLVQFLQSPSGWVFILAALVVAFFVWRKNNQEKQRQAWLIWQQQQAALQQQQQQQEAALQQQILARQQWEQMERERQEQEGQERERRERKQERERLARLKTLIDILTLSPKDFEIFTGKILEGIGCHDVRHVGGSGDLGADLTALDPNGNSIVVQCKRYAPGHAIGSPEIQKFIGMLTVYHKADKGIFVTTSTFTQPAIDLAKAYSILLIDGDNLVEMLQSHVIQ